MMKPSFKKELPIILASLAISTTAVASDKVADKDSQNQPSITVYQAGFALISEARHFALDHSQQQLFLPNVAPETVMESLMISFTPDNAGDPIPFVTEKKLNRNLLSPQSMVQYSVGEKVDVITAMNGKEKREEATILSNNGGLLLQYKDRIELNLPENARLAFKQIPKGLNNTPVLSVILKNLPGKNTQYRTDLSYITQGISWNADYIATLNDVDKTLKLEGWATVNNSSGMDYQDFQIHLIAGDLNLATPSPRFKSNVQMMRAEALSSQADDVSSVPLGDYHQYDIADISTLNDKEQTQISLFQKDQIPFTKNYTFNSSSPTHRLPQTTQLQNAAVSIHFNNDEASALGFPLPTGAIRLYEQNVGKTTFIGGDQIPATPKDQKVSLNIGNAFDITLNREQTRFSTINPDEWEISYKLTINNAKNEAVTTIVKEGFYPNNDTNWQIIKQSIPPKINGDTATWSIKVPANGQKVITYSVRYTIFNNGDQNTLFQ